jgi:hypothetical protein
MGWRRLSILLTSLGRCRKSFEGEEVGNFVRMEIYVPHTSNAPICSVTKDLRTIKIVPMSWRCLMDGSSCPHRSNCAGGTLGSNDRYFYDDVTVHATSGKEDFF